MSKLIVNTLPDTLINYWGNPVTNTIEKHGRKGANQYTTIIWYIRCEEKENIQD